MKRRLWVLAMVAGLVGCSTRSHVAPPTFATNPAFKGKITMTIAEPHQFSEGDTDRTYRYDLDAGRLELKQISDSGEQTVHVQQFATGGVSCYNAPRLRSPDGKLVAHCEGPFPGLPRGTQPDSLVVEDMRGKQVLKRPIGNNLQMVGYAWAPDSRSIAVAVSSSRTSLYPLDLLWAIVGHPIPVAKFDVELFSTDGKAAMTLPCVQGDFRLGFGMLTGWN